MALADEMRGPRGSLLPIQGLNKENSAELQSDIKTLSGKLALVESQLSMLPQGVQQTTDWNQVRIGANTPAPLVELQKSIFNEVLAVCGVSPLLFDEGASGPGAREAWRQLLFGVVAPLGRLVSSELTLKLEQEISFEWSELRASDIQGRARAFQSMVGAGIDVADARKLAGLNE